MSEMQIEKTCAAIRQKYENSGLTSEQYWQAFSNWAHTQATEIITESTRRNEKIQMVLDCVMGGIVSCFGIAAIIVSMIH